MIRVICLATVVFGCQPQASPNERPIDVTVAPDPGAKADGVFDPRRADLVLSELRRVNAKLTSKAREEKYARMAGSAFAFFRGSAHLFYRDLAALEAAVDGPLSAFEGPETWLVGDMHPENIGAVEDDDGRVTYEVNDFDESVVGPYLYDVWRMGAGIVLSAGAFEPRDQDRFVAAFAEAYVDSLRDGPGASGLTADDAPRVVRKMLKRAARSDRRDLLKAWTDDGRFDLSHEDLLPVDDGVRAALEAALPEYVEQLRGPLSGRHEWFEVVDIARRVGAGLGSLGTDRFYILVEGPTGDADDDRILDVKAQGVPAPLSPTGSP